MVVFLVYCIGVSTDQIEDPKHQKGAEHSAETHAQQERRREHKHDDLGIMQKYLDCLLFTDLFRPNGLFIFIGGSLTFQQKEFVEISK